METKFCCDKCKKSVDELWTYKAYLLTELKWYCEKCFGKVMEKNNGRK